MKRISFSFSRKQRFFLVSCVLSILLALGLLAVSSRMKQALPHELVAQEWDSDGETAHVSIFFSESEKYELKKDLKATKFRMESWYHQLLTELQNASVTADEDARESARLAIYGYSAAGTVEARTERGRTSVKAYGVGGDFFQFHPLRLVSGGYFSESDLMQDRVILDTETAWQLFGSYDVVGMFLAMDGVPHMVVGVYERENGYFNDAAGNDKSCIYVSHETLFNHGKYHGLESVEYLLPNPVTGFALGLVEQQCNGMDVAVVEHQNRFSVKSLFGILGEFGTRSMGLSGITFPYWENMARGYEDILAGLLLVELILVAYVVMVLIGWLWYLWMHRKWRAAHIFRGIKDRCYALSVKGHRRRESKRSRKAAETGEELAIEEID